ncbi:hypothetical protein PLICRDRAFT_169556 [Plicaturopsis crispa FD-325 SS-3]|nr:hypothetical protein PLICRDRAFT_169556 [Plicaturopsis crispa FD-325 SS-3]
MALAHSPEQQERWRDLVRSDPAYVVAVLSAFPPDMGSLDGPVQDILAAYAAVFKATDECRPDVWPALVDAGLVDTLCINITRGHASRAGVWIQHWLARFEPLRVLGTMVMRFSSPTNATDMKAMVILRKRWIKMVDSLWEDDYYVRVRDQEQLAFARAMFAEVFFLIIIEQPEFTSEIETTSIKTIRLLARYWSASELFSIDGHSTSHALSEFMQPATGALSAYRTSHPPHPSLFNIILEGAGNSPAQFLTIMAAHVARMPERTDTVFDVSIIHALSQFACDPRSQQDPLSSAFMLQYCEHSALWSALLVVLFESAGHDRLYVPTDKTGFAHKGFTLTVQNIVTMMADALHYLDDGSDLDLVRFVRGS